MKPKCICATELNLDPVSGLFRADKIPVFRFINKGGILFIQFQDSNKPRSDGRGTNLVEIEAAEFFKTAHHAGVGFEG